MKYIRLKSVGVLTLLAAFSVGVAGCQNKEQGQGNKKEEKIAYLETEEAKLDRGMDNLPEASYWFPEDLLKWDFSKDPDAKYNVSTTPLGKRVDKKSLEKVNETQDPEMQVVALSIMNSSTSGNAPHGINTFEANTFSSWQYIDKMVYWGGSSGEGIIVSPSADVIDAAHKNGVPILGTIFFPQTAHGGKIEWLTQFLEKDKDGKFPIVDKLIQVANDYGFDGWFINQETDNEVTSFDEAAENKAAGTTEATSELNQQQAALMQELIKEYKEKAGDTQEVMWYDSMTEEGKMDWQNALTDKNDAFLVDAQMKPVADDMFLNFWWNTNELAGEKLLEKSAEKAKELGINPYNLFAGIDVQEEGYNTPTRWSLFTDKNNKPYTSLGLYVPDWTYFSGGSPDDILEKETTFWVNGKADPTLSVPVADEKWPGVSTYAPEQTALTKTPFVTNFNMGNGYNYFINGKKVSALDWNNRSMQDILPTYRWIFEHGEGNDLTVSMDYAEAYQGGNSLKLRGTMKEKQPSTMKLYASDFSLEKDTIFTTTAKASDKTQLNLILTLEDGTNETIKGDKKVGEDWTKVTYDVTKLAGKKVKDISYSLESEKTNDVYELRLGQMAITGKETTLDGKVQNVKIEDAIFDEEESNFAGVRMTWEGVSDKTLSHYNIYRINKDKTRSFLGATPATAHYINALERNDDTNKTNFVIVPVDIWGNQGKDSATVTLDWPNNALPKAAFKASRTLIAPGDTVTFTNTSSKNTTSLKWKFEGGSISESDEEEPQVTYDKPGTYAVSLTAKNKEGETPVEIKEFITVSEKAKGDLTLLSENAKTEASGFTNDSEAPEFAVDGKLDTKWCATGTPPHEIILDLGSVSTISEVHLSHAEAGGESPDMNTKAYSILVSEDGKEYTQVTRVITNTSAESVDTFPATKARFVKLTVDKPTQGSDSAVRIYEMGVYGLK